MNTKFCGMKYRNYPIRKQVALNFTQNVINDEKGTEYQ
jgi:hypothetical protein